MNRIVLIISCIVVTIGVQSQDTLIDRGLFKKRDFGQYFYADLYSPTTNIGIGITPLYDYYDVGNRKNNVIAIAEPILGAQLPVYYFGDERNKWSFSMPISFSVWFDLTESRTSPVLNTDYRIGAIEINYSRILKNSSLKNIGLRFIPYFHESTHIGDELLITKVKDSIPFSRINVSYETFELAVIINDPYNQRIRNHSVRIGAKCLWNSGNGYYRSDSLDVVNPIDVPPSERWIEPYVQYQYQNPDCWLSNDRMMFVFSQDFNLRVRYGYGYYLKNEQGVLTFNEPGEAYQLCSSTMFGWRLYNTQQDASNTSVFFKFYWGLNPHGQFRNTRSYPYVGLNWVFEI